MKGAQSFKDLAERVSVAEFDGLEDKTPAHAMVESVKYVTLIITGGVRIAEDFAEAIMLGADAIAVSNAAIQATGCLGMRACHTNNCLVGIATQQESLRSRLEIQTFAKQLFDFLTATDDLIKVIARACGHNDISAFNSPDLSTFDYDMYELTGIRCAGVNP